MENRFRRADGAHRWVLSTGAPRFEADGSFAGYAGSCVDVTEQRRAHEDRERFFTLSADLLAIADLNGRPRRLNPAWERTLGHPLEEMLGCHFIEFIHPDDHAASLAALARPQAGRDVVGFENRYRCRDGSYRWLSRRATSFAGDELIYAAARDVTAEKEAAVALARACDRALETDLSAEQREYLEVVRTSAGALLTLIDDILDLSKIEAGRLQLDPVPFGPREHFAEALKPLAVRAAQKGLSLRGEVAADVPATVVGDPGRIRQVLVNLVANAVKFTATGEVTVRLAGGANGGDRVVLQYTVTDTGIGIAREGNVAARLPIIAVTAHAMKGDRERCLDAGMDAYLAKPVAADELLATIDRLVRPVPSDPGPPPAGPAA